MYLQLSFEIEPELHGRTSDMCMNSVTRTPHSPSTDQLRFPVWHLPCVLHSSLKFLMKGNEGGRDGEGRREGRRVGQREGWRDGGREGWKEGGERKEEGGRKKEGGR